MKPSACYCLCPATPRVRLRQDYGGQHSSWPTRGPPSRRVSLFTSLRRAKAGADDRTRTGDLVLTKDALYLLSYIGSPSRSLPPPSRYGGQARPHDRAQRPGRPAVARGASEGWSGRRGSNPRPTAWKAVTLPLSYSRLRVPPTAPNASADRPAAGCYRRTPDALLRLNRSGPRRPTTVRPISFDLRRLQSPGPDSTVGVAGLPAEARPPSALLPAVTGEGWWRGEDSNLRRR